MTFRAVAALTLPTTHPWPQLWSRAPVPLDVLAELMTQAPCLRAARLIALRTMTLGYTFPPAMAERLVQLHVAEDPNGALRVVRNLGLESGTASLLEALVASNRITQAWEVYEKSRTEDLVEVSPEICVSMLRACAKSKNPDAADRLIDVCRHSTPEIEAAYIIALATRQRTLGRAMELYNRFLQSNSVGSCEAHLMKACERYGHTERAKTLWKKVRARTVGKDMDPEVLVSYILTFKHVSEEKEKVVRYLWSLVLEANVTTPLLNAMIVLFGSSQLLKNVMETWQSFASFQLTENAGTYEALLGATTTNHECFLKVWQAWMVSEFDPSTRMCDLALEMFSQWNDMEHVLMVLQHMHTKKVPLRRDMSREAARNPAIQRLLRNID